MNIKYIDKNRFIVRINSSLLNINDKNLNESIKEILINVKKKYNVDIYGFFNVDLYEIDNILYLLEFEKNGQDNYFYKTIDLKIKKHSKKIQIVLNDFLIDKENIYKMCEHYFINN